MRIRSKLLLTFFVIGILSVSITGWLGFENARTTLDKVYFEQLTAIRETKKRQIETYFNQITNQVQTFSENQMIVDAMNQFKAAFYNLNTDNSDILNLKTKVLDYYENEFLLRLKADSQMDKDITPYWPEDDNTLILQYNYIANNPHPTGFKDRLKMAEDGSEYSRLHSEYHPIIHNYLKKFGYYDIFLVDDKTGFIVYSVFKEVDFATNLMTGPYKETNFAKVFLEAQKAQTKDFVKLVDFEPYEPSYADPASFIASPIFDGDKKIGTLIFQMPKDEINRVMTGNYNWANEGLGESGETYLVGADYKMRSDSRFISIENSTMLGLKTTSILKQVVNTEAVIDALKGNTDTKFVDDYRGKKVLCSYTPLNIKDVQWVILSEIDTEEAYTPFYILRNKILSTIVLVSLFVLVTALVFSKAMSKPILVLIETMKNVRKGNLDEKVDIKRNDEIGSLAKSFNEMVLNLKSSRDELVDSNNYIKNIIKSMGESLIVLSPDTHIRSVNRSTCKLLGYGEDELTGQPYSKIFAEKVLIFDGDKMDDLLKVGYIGTSEQTFLTKYGKMIPVDFSCSIMRGNDNNIEGIVCMAQDITERKRIEAHIRKLHRAVEQSPGIVVITDIKGNIEYVNPKFTELTGYTLEEVMNKTPRILKSGKSNQDVYKNLWETIKRGEEWKGEFQNKKKNGELYLELVSISPIRNNNNIITHFIKSGEDITMRKLSEQKLQSTQEQLIHAEKLGAVGRLSASIAHEFNNPIFGIRNVLERIRKGMQEDSENAEFVDMAVRECNRVASLIRNLQDFNRPSSGMASSTNIHRAIDDMLMLIRKELDTRRIKLVQEYSPKMKNIEVISDQIKQVILNLLKNAAEAIPKTGGTITIRTEVLNTSIRIDIKDTGHGIKPENINHIFEPFFTTKAEVKGTGLGLSVSYGIIKKHGGEIVVESEPDKGTTFIIMLPIKHNI